MTDPFIGVEGEPMVELRPGTWVRAGVSVQSSACASCSTTLFTVQRDARLRCNGCDQSYRLVP